jgi:serine/threonine protein kinase
MTHAVRHVATSAVRWWMQVISWSRDGAGVKPCAIDVLQYAPSNTAATWTHGSSRGSSGRLHEAAVIHIASEAARRIPCLERSIDRRPRSIKCAGDAALTPRRSDLTIPAVVTEAAEVGSTANRYQILGKLAVGGMAEIFLARGEGVAGVERHCVLKRILRDRAGDAQFIRMFLDEARLAAQLQHPNIASTYDVGMLGGAYFFTMEYVHGETVWSILQRAAELARPLPLGGVLTVIAGVAAGLAHAHERRSPDGRPLGIVHRDLSPSNVMVSFEGIVKIVDFGVAKAANRAVETHAGAVRGTISYLSPEQCRGERVDRRSDLFSLGTVMWEMLTGERLYGRASDFENMTAIVHEPAPPPSSRRPGLPGAVDGIVLRLLAKPAEQRYQTAGEVVLALEDVAMRSGTMLSTPAVSRLVHELFGSRAEPWLLLDGPAPRESVTVMSQPVPDRPGAAIGDAVELELARVPDLSARGAARSTTLPPRAVELPPADPTGAGIAADPPTTLSEATGVATRAPARTRPRVALAAGLAGLAIAGGTAVAVALERGGDAGSAVPAAPVRPDPAVEVRSQIARVLVAFAAWAPDHAGAPCPDAVALGASPDPWGHPWRITCTDQPGDQIVGVISAGPDGVVGSADDVASWQLGREVTDAVTGARWAAAPPAAVPDPKPAKPAEHRPRRRTGGVALDPDGLPVSR